MKTQKSYTRHFFFTWICYFEDFVLHFRLRTIETLTLMLSSSQAIQRELFEVQLYHFCCLAQKREMFFFLSFLFPGRMCPCKDIMSCCSDFWGFSALCWEDRLREIWKCRFQWEDGHVWPKPTIFWLFCSLTDFAVHRLFFCFVQLQLVCWQVNKIWRVWMSATLIHENVSFCFLWKTECLVPRREWAHSSIWLVSDAPINVLLTLIS